MVTVGLLIVTAIWGLTFVTVQSAVADYSAFSFLTLRFALAALALLPFSVNRIGKKELLVGVPVGATLGLGMLLQTVGLRSTTATNSGFITSLYVVFAPIISALCFRSRFHPRIWVAVILSTIGLFLVSKAGLYGVNPGDALTLGCAVLFGIQIALLSRYSPGLDSAALAFIQTVTSVFMYLPVVFLTRTPLITNDLDVWLALLITGLGASAFGFWMQTYAQQRMSAARAAVIMAMEPVFAAIGGYTFAGDRMTILQWFGAAFMMAGLFVAEILPYLKHRVSMSQRLGETLSEKDLSA